MTGEICETQAQTGIQVWKWSESGVPTTASSGIGREHELRYETGNSYFPYVF